MKAEAHAQVGQDGVGEEADRIAMLARKATRKAARVAEKDGYYSEHADGVCLVRSAGKAVKIAVKTTPIDTRKHYVFSSGTH